MVAGRHILGDWYEGGVPENVVMSHSAHVETSHSFEFFRSRRPDGLVMGEASSIYFPTILDIGPEGRLTLGKYAMLQSPHITCDLEIEIGDYALISWNVVLMDNYRTSPDAALRKTELERIGRLPLRARVPMAESPRPIRIGNNVWIGFDACVLPGVTIGDGSIVGAKSVVVEDVAAYTVVAGNPARMIRTLARAS
jgi:acetyltransferase-like isoleucine patch superfamily enzyme